MWYQRFLKWLEVRPSGREVVVLILGLFVLKFILSLVFGAIIAVVANLVGDDLASRVTNHPLLNEKLRAHPSATLVVLFVFIVFEEFLFRFLPLKIMLKLVHSRPHLRWVVVPTILISGVAFGLFHVSNYVVITPLAVVASIVLQGLGGILLGILFVKYTAFDPARENRAFMVTTCAHALWNAILLTLALAI